MVRKQGNDEETLYYHNDHLGTPKLMTDKLGKVVWNVEFDPFGNEVEQKGRKGGYVRDVENNLRFPGQYFDVETGLHQNGFRDYNPNGRYLEFDPVGLRGGLNPFVYANSNPIRYADASGLFSTTDAVLHYFTGSGSQVTVVFSEVDANLQPSDFDGYTLAVQSMYKKEGTKDIDLRKSKDIGGWAGHLTYRLKGIIKSDKCE